MGGGCRAEGEEQRIRTEALLARIFWDAVEEFGGFGSVVSCGGGVGRG